MSGDDVHRDEMETPFEFSDEAAEGLLAGRGAGVDPSVAGLLDELRSTYQPSEPFVGHELSSFFQETPVPSRFGSRVGWAAKAAAVVAAVLAATGGLAVAGALPGPVQHAFSHAASDLGVHIPGDDQHSAAAVNVEAPGANETTTAPPTTVAPPETTTVVPERHGDVVSGVAHSDTVQGCEHGRAVSAVASGKVNAKPCPHTTTTTTPGIETTTTTTTVPEHANHGKHHQAPPATTPSGHAPGTTTPSTGSSHSGNQTGSS
jgi:hypothetical protein